MANMYLFKHIFKMVGIRIAPDPVHICQYDWGRLV